MADEFPTNEAQHPDPLILATARELALPPAHVERVVNHYLGVVRDETWSKGTVAIADFGWFKVMNDRVKFYVAANWMKP